jgi:hypothetical protein
LVRSVQLDWETATEINNIGYNVYRSTSKDNVGFKINKDMIPSADPGSSYGAQYQFIDKDVRPNRVYYYWLVDIDQNGGVTLHGPVSVQALKK